MDKLALFRTSATAEFNEWAAIVPDEARRILSKDEIQRQSNIYELIQAERNFVVDIEIFLYVSPFPNLPNAPNYTSRVDIPGRFVIRQPTDYTKPREVADVPTGSVF